MSGGQSLHAAASGGDVARVRSILTTPRSYTAGFQSLLLSRAASTSRAGAATAIDELDSSGCTALQRAAAEGHEEICRLLLAHGADVNRKDTLHGNTALHEAAWKGYSRTVGLLAAAGANLGPPNNGGFAPLHLCCQNGHNQSCRELLLANCDPDLQNNYGDTPLHTSARYGHAGVTRILISAQCRVSDQNKNGDTALHIAAAMGRRKLTRILLEAGCDKHLRNKQGETAKDIATRKDLNEIIHILNSTKPLKKQKHCDIKPSDKKRTKECTKDKHKKKSKVRFEPTGKHWSPYGCHYFPDPKSFPKPKLNSLPHEPLRKGEQYYLDLAGNICKGPIGVGYTCYCAPFFKHMEERLDRDKQELKAHIDKAHERLDHKVSNLERKTQGQISELTRCVQAERALCDKRHEHLEQWLMRNRFGRQSERVHREPAQEVLTRSRSLELLDDLTVDVPRNSKSMDLLDDSTEQVNETLMNFEFKSEVLKETTKGFHKVVQVDYHASDDPPRKTVSEIIAEIQNKEPVKRTELHIPIYEQDNEDSESSDDEGDKKGDYENLNGNFGPRMRSVLYTPSVPEEFPHIHVPPKLPYETGLYVLDNTQLNGYSPELHVNTAITEPNGYVPYRKPIDLHLLEKDVHNRIANLHLGNREAKKDINMIEHNDSGYSTKVYGSSQGNSPSLSGEVENINSGKVASQNRTINTNTSIGASSLV